MTPRSSPVASARPRIISASRRTDIPAFFSAWFMRRVAEGFAVSVNPFHAKQARRVTLRPEDVDAIVFWSKDPRPLLRHLDELEDRGYWYYFQFTLNAYDKAIEPLLPPVAERITTFQELGGRLGKERVLWRYDPIILSSDTPPARHLDALHAIGEALRGYAGRLTISFMDFYPKVRERLSKVEESTGQRFYDAAEPGQRGEVGDLCRQIAALGRELGLPVVSCGEPLDLAPYGIAAGACIDAELVRRLRARGGAGGSKDPNQRPECLCTASVDIGAYNTCSHGCAYCYANFSPATLKVNLRRHRPDSPCLVGEAPEGDQA